MIFRRHPPEQTIWTVTTHRETTARDPIQRARTNCTFALPNSADGLPRDMYFQIASGRLTKLMNVTFSSSVAQFFLLC